MQYQNKNMIFVFILSIIMYLPLSLYAQEDIHTILERYRKEMKIKLSERYQYKFQEHHLDETRQRYEKRDSLRRAEEMKRMENRRMKMLDELRKKHRSRTTSKPARITAVDPQDSLALVALYNSTDW
ncbi:MAG: hypothetical protein R6V04_14005 [bacterium]